MFRLDLKIYLDRRITNRYILFIEQKGGTQVGGCGQQEESINKIPFYYLFVPFHNFHSTRICTKMNNVQFLSHENKRNFKKFVEQKNSFVTMGQSFGSRVTTLIHIECEYLFIFSSFRDIPKQLNIKAVKGTFWNLLSGTSYENFNAGGTRFFFHKNSNKRQRSRHCYSTKQV